MRSAGLPALGPRKRKAAPGAVHRFEMPFYWNFSLDIMELDYEKFRDILQNIPANVFSLMMNAGTDRQQNHAERP